MSLRKLLENYLKKARLMQLATSLNNQPWVCSVWFTSDKNLNIYWFSSTTRRYSKEVINNPNVAGAIVLPQAPKDPPRGLQFQGTAKLLTKQADVEKTTALFEGRIFSKKQIKDLMANKNKPHRFYKIKPTQFVLFDAVNFPHNSRQELNL